jgi:hypothetical protein
VPHQVRHEEDGAFEDADQEEVAVLVVGRDLLAERGDPALQRGLVDQDVDDGALELSRGQRYSSGVGKADASGSRVTGSLRNQ